MLRYFPMFTPTFTIFAQLLLSLADNVEAQPCAMPPQV